MVKSSRICLRSNVFFGGMTSLVIFVIILTGVALGAILYYIPRLTSQQSVFQKQLLSEAKKSNQVVVKENSRSSDKSFPTSQYVSRNPDFENFTNVGYIFNSTGRFPLYMNRINNRYYYFTRDDSRNNIKIPIGDEDFGLKDEYYDGDTLSVPELSSSPFNVKIYENKTNIYKPFGINVY